MGREKETSTWNRMGARFRGYCETGPASAARTGTTTDTNRWLLWVRYLLSVQMGDAYAADWHESL